jgi:hypothetical protein
MVAKADAIVTFNINDFAAPHLIKNLQIEVIHPDDFVMDLVDLNEKRAVAAFRELMARKKNPPLSIADLIQRLRDGGLIQRDRCPLRTGASGAAHSMQVRRAHRGYIEIENVCHCRDVEPASGQIVTTPITPYFRPMRSCGRQLR